MDDVLILVSYSYEQDDYGVPQKTASTSQIFCQVNSITRLEFYEAGRNGLNPELKFTIFAGDYAGQKVCQYNGAQYSIYRTYHIPGTDYMELVVQREGGTNATVSTSSS